MKKLATILLTLTTVITGYGQTYETKNYIRIPANVEVTKTVKAKNCDELIKAGSQLFEVFFKKK